MGLKERERKKSKPFLPALKFTSLKVQDIKGRKMYISPEVFAMRGKLGYGGNWIRIDRVFVNISIIELFKSE